MTESTERRHHPRQPVITKAIILQNDLVTGGGMVRNLSQGGVFIETGPVSLPVGSLLEVGLATSEDGRIPAVQEAVVIHRNSAGMAVQFLEPLEGPLPELAHPRAEEELRQEAVEAASQIESIAGEEDPGADVTLAVERIRVDLERAEQGEPSPVVRREERQRRS